MGCSETSTVGREVNRSCSLGGIGRLGLSAKASESE